MILPLINKVYDDDVWTIDQSGTLEKVKRD